MKTIVTITGPTCSGKDYLLQYFLYIGYAKLVSVTTRPPRPGEVEGESYYFIGEEEFAELKSSQAFSQTVEFSQYNYGVTYSEIEKKLEARNNIAFVIVEPGGVDQYAKVCKELGYGHFKLFVDTKQEIIEARMQDRTVSQLSQKELSDTKIEGILRRYKEVITGKERDWNKLQDWDLVLDGTMPGFKNHTYFLNAYTGTQLLQGSK
jgi:guanylate kinase